MFLDGFGGDGDTNIDTGLEQWLHDIRVVEMERKEPVLGHSQSSRQETVVEPLLLGKTLLSIEKALCLFESALQTVVRTL